MGNITSELSENTTTSTDINESMNPREDPSSELTSASPPENVSSTSSATSEVDLNPTITTQETSSESMKLYTVKYDNAQIRRNSAENNTTTNENTVENITTQGCVNNINTPGLASPVIIKRSSINLTIGGEGNSSAQHRESNEIFKQELEKKHEKWRQLIAEKRREMLTLREELEKQKKENYDLKNSLDDYKQENEELKLKLTNAGGESITRISEDLEKYKHENDSLRKSAQQLEIAKKENEELKRKLSTANDLKEENEDLKLQVEKLKLELKSSEEIVSKNKELRISLAEMQGDVQNLNIELLNIEQERLEYGKHIGALKDVVRVTKEMLAIRENQIEELKGKIKTVEELLASKEMKIMSDGLREEYERQLRNIRNLRALYEERQRLDKKDKENLQEQLDETKKQVEDEQKKNSELQERVIELEKDTSLKYDTITSLQSNLGLSKAECKELQAEINIINQLFSEILLGFKSTQEIDLDKLIRLLEENHDLLTNMATNEESNSTSAALPKLLLDLINQMNKEDEAVSFENSETTNQTSHQLNSAEEIVETLPKVWKVLMELLSHQNPPLNALFGPSQEPCYKLIETSKGAKLKLSVSQTFIRLKDLILEKKFLERETYRLKHLNTHLEGRLQDQEKRLELVSGEVKNTWHVVDKMQRQHQQLHTHEKVLRYELQQKRQLLNELKEDLQYCREKWVEARAKNDTTHSQWKELRKEFADRKNKSADDNNQSAESGYSDGKDSSEDERGYESDVSEGKHETDVETDGEQKTESVQINEKRQIVQNDRLECASTTSLDIVADGEVELTTSTSEVGGEIGLSATNEDVELNSSNDVELQLNEPNVDVVLTASNTNTNEETHLSSSELRHTERNSHIEAGTKRLENLLEAREIRLKKLEEYGSQLVSRAIGRDGSGNSTITQNNNTPDRSESSSINESHDELETSKFENQVVATSGIVDEDESLISKSEPENAEDLTDQTQSKSSNDVASSVIDEASTNISTDASAKKTDFEEANLTLDREVQELFDEMCKFVEQGTGAEGGDHAEAKSEAAEQVLSAREERLHRLEEEFKEFAEIEVNETETNETQTDERSADVNINSDENGLKKDTIPDNKNQCSNNEIDEHIENINVTHNDETQSEKDVTNNKNGCDSKKENVLEINEMQETSKQEEVEKSSFNNSDNENTIYTNTLILNNPSTISTTVSNKNTDNPPPRRSTEEILQRREERLKRLEAQSQLLLAKTRKTTQKSNVICEKLDELHGIYGDASNQESKPTNDTQDETTTTSKPSRKVREEILMRREARLRKLDAQCKALLAKIMKRTENKNESVMLIEKKFTVTSNPDDYVEGDNSVVIPEDNQSMNAVIVDSHLVTNFEGQMLDVGNRSELPCDTHVIKTDVTKDKNERSAVVKMYENSSDSESINSSMLEDIAEPNGNDCKDQPCDDVISKLLNEENLKQLEERCRGLLTEIRNPHQKSCSKRKEEITSALSILLPQLIQSIEDEIVTLTTFYVNFKDHDGGEEEKSDEASALSSVAVSEELLDVREARFWKLGEQCWEIVSAVAVDETDGFFKS